LSHSSRRTAVTEGTTPSAKVICYAARALILIAIGLRYVRSKEFQPYHRVAPGHDLSSLDPALKANVGTPRHIENWHTCAPQNRVAHPRTRARLSRRPAPSICRRSLLEFHVLYPRQMAPTDRPRNSEPARMHQLLLRYQIAKRAKSPYKTEIRQRFSTFC